MKTHRLHTLAFALALAVAPLGNALAQDGPPPPQPIDGKARKAEPAQAVKPDAKAAAAEATPPEEVPPTPEQREKLLAELSGLSAELNQLQGENCEAVALVATPADAAAALGKAAQGNYAPTWLAQSPSWLKVLFAGDLRPYAEANVKLLSEGGDWGDESIPGMADMIAAMEQHTPEQEPDIYFAFGYNQARAVAQVLEAAVENGDLSHEGIIEAMNGIDELTFDGLLGDYGWGAPEDRDPPRASTIFDVDLTTPTGIKANAREYESDAAAEFEFQ